MANLPPRYESVMNEIVEMCRAHGKPVGLVDESMRLATEFFDEQVRGSNPETADWRLYSQDRRMWRIEQMTFGRVFPFRRYDLRFPGVDPGDILGYSVPVDQRHDHSSTQRAVPTSMGTFTQGSRRNQQPRPWTQGPPRVSPATSQEALVPRQRGFLGRREDYDRGRDGRDGGGNHYRNRSEGYDRGRQSRHSSVMPLVTRERSGSPRRRYNSRPPVQPSTQSFQANSKVEAKEDVFIKRELEEDLLTLQFSPMDSEEAERKDSGFKIKNE